nr:MAG TPA: hypothetical protein [Caudoviricetes sp.]
MVNHQPLAKFFVLLAIFLPIFLAYWRNLLLYLHHVNRC